MGFDAPDPPKPPKPPEPEDLIDEDGVARAENAREKRRNTRDSFRVDLPANNTTGLSLFS